MPQSNKSIYDEAVDSLKERLDDALGVIKERNNGVRKFREKTLSPKEKVMREVIEAKISYEQPFQQSFIPDNLLMEAYKSMNPDRMGYLIEKFGNDKLDKFMTEMEVRRQRYGR